MVSLKGKRTVAHLQEALQELLSTGEIRPTDEIRVDSCDGGSCTSRVDSVDVEGSADGQDRFRAFVLYLQAPDDGTP